MATIEQIQIKFVAVEDRLLLRVSSSDELEFRFWMTRRFINLIWPALHQAVAEAPRIQTQPTSNAKRELIAFEHETAVSNSDFATPFKETQKTMPLGDQPIVLAKMQMRRNESGAIVMALAPEQGQGIDLALNSGLLHSLIELISNAARIAEWDLSSLVEDEPVVTAPDNVTVN